MHICGALLCALGLESSCPPTCALAGGLRAECPQDRDNHALPWPWCVSNPWEEPYVCLASENWVCVMLWCLFSFVRQALRRARCLVVFQPLGQQRVRQRKLPAFITADSGIFVIAKREPTDMSHPSRSPRPAPPQAAPYLTCLVSPPVLDFAYGWNPSPCGPRVWLTSQSVVLSEFIRVVACVPISLLSKADSCSPVWKDRVDLVIS